MFWNVTATVSNDELAFSHLRLCGSKADGNPAIAVDVDGSTGIFGHGKVLLIYPFDVDAADSQRRRARITNIKRETLSDRGLPTLDLLPSIKAHLIA